MTKEDLRNGKEFERIIGHAFTAEELRLLFANKEFQSGVATMLTVEDALRVIDTGCAILKENSQ